MTADIHPPRAAPLLLCAMLVLGAAAPVGPSSGTLPIPGEDQVEALIRPESAMATVEQLCDRALRGRMAGTGEYNEAAEAMAARFAAAGLQPGGADGFLRPNTLELNEVLGSPVLARIGTDGVEIPWTHGPDFVTRGFTGSGDVAAPVVFAGYGLVDGKGWDDYGELDVRGKVVLAFKQAPPWEVEGGWGEVHLPRPKARAAAERGAAALLLVSRPLDEPPQPLIGSLLHGPGEHVADLPALQVTQEVAQALLAGSGRTLADLQRAIDEDRAPAPQLLETRVHVRVEARHTPAADAPNVVAILRGSDPDRAHEHVILGAHLDHVGQQGDVLYPGANDNASGTAAVVATAEALARSGLRPPRSVVFVLFSGEEQGLYGAKAYVADPVLPIEHAVAMLNADGVGFGGLMRVGGAGASPVLHALVRALDARTTRFTSDDTWYGGGADAQPFFDAGVPTLYLAAEGGWTHLHQPTDHPDTIRPNLLASAARLMFLTASAVAHGHYDREERQSRREGD